jgi:REP element-mobilizing transposase RayT
MRVIEGRNIFKDYDDREDFIERLEELLPDTQTACYAWAFIPNHAHFLLRTGLVPLSALMRKLLTGYAMGFNRRHERRGQLFQNRYKSIICQEEAYLKELVRYIHLNPIRAGLVSTLEELNRYPYCGHSGLIGRKERAWQDAGYVLGYFGDDNRNSRVDYLSFVEAGLDQGRRKELMGGGLIRSLGGWSEVKQGRNKGEDHVMGDERILGDSDFVEAMLAHAEEKYERRYELKRRGYDLERVAQRVAEVYKMETEEVFSQGRQQRKVKARSLLCFWAVRELGISLTALARKLEMSVPGVGYAAERGEAIARNEKLKLIQ